VKINCFYFGDSRLLGYDAVLLGNIFLAFWMKVVHSFWGVKGSKKNSFQTLEVTPKWH